MAESEKCPRGGWTPDLLHSLMMRLFEEQERLNKERFVAQKESVGAALGGAERLRSVVEENLKEWRRAANEWRQAMDDRERKFATREMVEQEVKALKELLAQLKESSDLNVGARHQGDVSGNKAAIWLGLALSALVGLAGLAIGVASMFLRHQ